MSADTKYTRNIAEWAAGVSFEDVPSRVIENAKLQVLSVLGSLFAGYNTEAGRRLLSSSGRWTGDGPCSQVPGGRKLDPAAAAAANSALSMLLDYDDYMIAAHSGHSAVTVPLALAQQERVDGKQLLLAQTIANEIEGRISGSVMFGPFNGQMCSFVHAAGTACAAGRIAGLDADAMQNALSISLSQPPHPLDPGFLAGYSKLLTAASPIKTGFSAALMAADGLSGPGNILEAPGGFCESYSFAPLYSMLTGLGACWLSDTLSYKIYPGCAYIDSVLDCVFEILRTHPVRPKDIYKIDVRAGLFTVRMDDLSRRLVRHRTSHPVTLNFYTPYNVAAALIDGEISPAQFEPSRIDDPELWDLAKRVAVSHDPSITTAMVSSLGNLIDLRSLPGQIGAGSLRSIASRLGIESPFSWMAKSGEIMKLLGEGRKLLTGRQDREPGLAESAAGFEMAFGAKVSLHLKKNNRRYDFEQKIPYGAAGRPRGEVLEDVTNKFRKEAALAISEEAAAAVIDGVSRLETLDPAGVRRLVSLCCTPEPGAGDYVI